MFSLMWGLAFIAISVWMNRLLLGIPLGFAMGISTLASDRFRHPAAGLFNLLALSSLFLVWPILVLGIGVQLSEALTVPRWAFWVSAAFVALVPQQLQYDKMRTFGATSGDGIIYFAILAQFLFYLVLVFTPARTLWLNLFGVFDG